MRKWLSVLGLGLTPALGAVPVTTALAASPSASPTVQSTAPSGNSVSGSAIVQTALHYLGYPYTTVGNSPATGFSCIGFVSYVYGANGIPLPDDLQAAMNYAPAVTFSNLTPGDILFFQNTVWTGLSHTAIYVGGGRFVHAEWYNRGVVISSFNNDPVDGNYWITKYLGANRPWSGPAGPSAAVPPTLQAGTTAVVTWQLLNLRSGPSASTQIKEPLSQGTLMTVLSEKGGWYQVKLADGTVGWVLGDGIGPAATASPPLGAQSPASVPQSAVSATSRRPSLTVPVSALRVHSLPSLHAPTVAVLQHGDRVQILAHKGGWAHVQLTDGTTGWAMESYLGIRSPAPAVHGTISVPLRVHIAASVTSRVLTVLPSGSRVLIVGKNGSWLKVKLANGTTGYVAAKYVKT